MEGPGREHAGQRLAVPDVSEGRGTTGQDVDHTRQRAPFSDRDSAGGIARHVAARAPGGVGHALQRLRANGSELRDLGALGHDTAADPLTTTSRAGRGTQIFPVQASRARMPSLLFRLKKRADAAAQLTLVREDGTHSTGPVGSAEGYFPVHDLTH